MRPADERRDEELVGSFYDGDAEAFNVLTRRWWKRLIGYFHRLGFGAEDAEDLAVETLVRLHGTRERLGFDSRHPLEPFLFKCAYNLAIEAWRKRSRRAVPYLFGETVADRDGLPPRLSEAILEDLYLCIERLPELAQQYLFLCGKHGLGDCDHLRIAAILERSPARVTQISRRALRDLRHCLSEHGY